MKKIITSAIRLLPTLILVAFFLIVSFPSGKLQACLICVPYPERTLADRLLENDEIIFARELQNSPFVFSQVETLRGGGTTVPIKMFCDSSTRRKLKAIPESVVVLAQKRSEDKWKLVTFADSEYQSFIRAITKNSSDWADVPGNQERVNYFAKHLSSEHPHIQEQAYLEVGRAPYGTIKSLANSISREQIYDFLGNILFIEWHSLYILFLGQSSHPEDHAYIRQQLESNARLEMTTNLSAWLTAYIETNPDTGVADIEAWYFNTPDRSKKELEEVLTSMSVLGSQSPLADLPLFALREKIVNSYGTLLKNYPEMAGWIAKDLAMWQVQAHLDRLSEIQQTNKVAEPSEVYLLNYYLSMAKNYQRTVYDGVD